MWRKIPMAARSANVSPRSARQVLSRGDLIALIEQNDLYPDERRSKPMSEIIEKMREATTVGALANDIGKSDTDDVIALNMSFDYPDPAKARDVLQSYVSSFLRIDSDDLEDQARSRSASLKISRPSCRRRLRTIESQITVLKARNGAALAGSRRPPFIDTRQLQRADRRARKRRTANCCARPTGRAGRDSHVAAAEAALAAAQAQYSDSHPDVVAARERLCRHFAASVPPATISGQRRSRRRFARTTPRSPRYARNAAAPWRAPTPSMSGQARAPAILEQASQLESRASALARSVEERLGRSAEGAEQLAHGERATRRAAVAGRAARPARPAAIAQPPADHRRRRAARSRARLFLALVVELLARPLAQPGPDRGDATARAWHRPRF